jgi:predicted CoA-substrate-specific enzyme activase
MAQYLGVDIGSISVKAVVLDGDAIVDKVYLKNQGIIASCQQVLKELPLPNVDGVGITGSGSHFASSLIGGDYIDSEIMAHCTSVLKHVPNARTVIDVGGEDSKLMLIKDGILSDFQMNYSCSSGTGAVVEAIAARLGIKVEDVGDVALKSTGHITMSSKCGIFMMSEVVSQLNKGRSVNDILMGVCRAMVSNYLALARGKRLEPPIVFQGAVAKNRGVVRAFEETLGPVIIPEYPEFAGAVGIALLCEENMVGYTKFRGKDAILNHSYQTKVWYCKDCENECEILSLIDDGKAIANFGSRCGKHE